MSGTCLGSFWRLHFYLTTYSKAVQGSGVSICRLEGADPAIENARSDITIKKWALCGEWRCSDGQTVELGELVSA